MVIEKERQIKNNVNGLCVTPRSHELELSNYRLEYMLAKVLKNIESNDDNLKEILADIFGINQKVDSHATTIKQLEQQMGQIFSSLNQWNKASQKHSPKFEK